MRNNNYEKFRNSDLEKSKELALKLGVPKDDSTKIESWFDRLLIEDKNARNDYKQIETEKELENQFAEISAEINLQSNKYILAKILTYNNMFHSGFLRSTFTRIGCVLDNHLIPKYLNVIKPKYSVEEFVALSEYSKSNFFVSPNGQLLENILKIEKSNKIFPKSTTEQRLKLTENLTNIIIEKKYHHDIICFKKILNLILEEDKNTIAFIKKFEVGNSQGCYLIIHKMLNIPIANDLWEDFELKKEVIQFFDTTKGAKPNEKWLSKFAELSLKIGSEKLQSIANEVMKFTDKRNHYFNDISFWSDNTAKRFLKSANWIIEKTQTQ